MSNAEEIKKLKELLDSGALTNEEFQVEKNKILNKSSFTNNKKILMTALLITGIITTYLFINNDTGQNTTEIINSQDTNENYFPEDELIVDNLEKAKKATVKIITNNEIIGLSENFRSESNLVRGTGSGFFINDGEYIVTNYHVISGSRDIRVFSDYWNKEIEAEIVSYSACDDLAIVKPKSKFNEDGDYYFEFSESSSISGMKLLNTGFPLGTNEITYSEGVVTKERADGNTTWTSLDFAFEHDLGILPGSSGGPIFNDDFKIVGIAYAGNDFNQKFAIEGLYSNQQIEKLILSNKKPNSFGLNVEQVPNLGAYINSVDYDSIAYQIGLRGGEIITNFGSYSLEDELTLNSYCKVIRDSSEIDSPYIKWVDLEKLLFYESFLNKANFTENPLPINMPRYTSIEIETFVKYTSFYWDEVKKQDYIVTYSGFPTNNQLNKLNELVDGYNRNSYIASYTLYKFGEHPSPPWYHFVFSMDPVDIIDGCKFQLKEWYTIHPYHKFNLNGITEDNCEETVTNTFERYEVLDFEPSSITWINAETVYEDSRGKDRVGTRKVIAIASETELEDIQNYGNKDVLEKCASSIIIYNTIEAFSGYFNKSGLRDSGLIDNEKYKSWFGERYCDGDYSQNLTDFDWKIIQIDQDPRLLNYQVEYDYDGNPIIKDLDEYVDEFKILFGSEY